MSTDEFEAEFERLILSCRSSGIFELIGERLRQHMVHKAASNGILYKNLLIPTIKAIKRGILSTCQDRGYESPQIDLKVNDTSNVQIVATYEKVCKDNINF